MLSVRLRGQVVSPIIENGRDVLLRTSCTYPLGVGGFGDNSIGGRASRRMNCNAIHPWWGWGMHPSW